MSAKIINDEKATLTFDHDSGKASLATPITVQKVEDPKNGVVCYVAKNHHNAYGDNPSISCVAQPAIIDASKNKTQEQPVVGKTATPK